MRVHCVYFSPCAASGTGLLAALASVGSGVVGACHWQNNLQFAGGAWGDVR